MKKTIFKKMLLALLLSLAVHATNAQNIYNVSVSNDMLVFATTADYKTVITGDTSKKNTFIRYIKANMNFSSLNRNQTSALYPFLDDGFIDVIVNKDGYIQLGSYV